MKKNCGIFRLEVLRKIAGKIKNISIKPFELKEPFVDFASRFSKDPGTVALMSGGDLDCARFHMLAIRPWLEVKGYGRNITLTADGKDVLLDCDPFEALRQVINEYTMAFDDLSIPIAAGLFGYLSYDLKDFIEALPRTSVDDYGLPQLCFFAPSVIIIHDKIKNRTHLCVANRLDFNGLKTGDDIETIESLLIGYTAKQESFLGGTTGLQSSFTQSAYMEAVKKIRDYIVSGDIYQVNLSQRFETDFSGDAFSMFKSLYQTAPGPFYAYINAGDHQIVSTSPERFLKRSKGDVETRPIKGTRPRGKDIAEDQSFSKELLISKKDDAELSMIVDLMRNDLGRVCRGGSVKVAEHKRLEAYQNVFHLVSVVRGELMKGRDSVDLIKATFPGGSITGCPRIRAMEIIDELEPVRRHVYTGSIGYLSFHDTLDLSIAIRTVTIFQNRMIFSVGGGVVFDSDPADEFEETLHKGRSIMGVLQAENAVVAPETREWFWQNGKLLPKDQAMILVGDLGFQYGLGFFETIRVENGRPLFLDDHIHRFYRAWDALFETPMPDLTWDVIIRQVIDKNKLEKQTAAVKIMATFGDRMEAPHHHNLIVTARKYEPRPAIIDKNGLGLVTYPHPRQTPLADHKTLNYAYYYLAGKWAKQQGADEALILNPDGSVSETNTANILLIDGKKVICPKSPHVLSGIMEARVIQYLVEQGYQAKTRNIIPDDLFTADQVIMTNSLIGAVPVLSLDGKKLNSSADLCQRICEAVLKE
ncbi:MAG: aminodeoxychorismate synthase component I [Desulfobacteraceae bacterium]|nr:aminodeoxychorismate synthase component I [Desulfobacteraceae bacterium]MBC2757732.1 aminodeoxychorismate synthase component I [Desulfobacteraceae bacterium]